MHIKYLSIKKLCLFATLFFILNSCKDPIWNVNEVEVDGWEPLLAIPLIHSKLTLQDIIAGSDTNIVKVDQDKFITLVFNENLKSFVASDLISIDDKTAPKEVFLTGPEINTLTGNGSISFSRTVTIDFDFEGDAVADDILFRTGNMVVEMNSYLQHDIQVEMIVPASTKNGQPLRDTVTITYQNASPVNAIRNISFADHLFDFEFNDPAKDNQFDIILNFVITFKNNPVSTGDIIDLKFNFQNMNFRSFYGYVGNETLDPLTDDIEIPLFTNEIEQVKFHVADPKVELLVKNGFGVPFQLAIDHLTFIDGQQSVQLQGSGVPAIFTINEPTLAQQGQKVNTSLLLDKNNSNIMQIMDLTPERFSFNITPQVNPSGVKTRNFILDDVGMDIEMNLLLPLYGAARGFKLQDTLEFAIESPEQIISLMLRTNLNNGFPIDLEMQVYLADENYQIIDSLLGNDRLIVSSAQINSTTGRVSAPTHKTTDIVFSDALLSKLSNVRYLLVTGVISTIDQGNTNVRIYSDYELDVKIGALAKIKGTL